MPEQPVCPDCGAPVRRLSSAGQCPACLLRLSLSVADGGLAFGLDEAPSAGQSAITHLSSEIQKVRYVGDYELLEEIGRGGMGVVYKARQVSLNRLVALKLVRAGEFADEKEVARFRAEAEAAAHLDHPNIVPIYEVGEHEGRHYFSMKLIEGGSLAEHLSRSSRRKKAQTSPTRIGESKRSEPPHVGCYGRKDTACLLATIARAVHYAHQRGLLHRDLKPGNILLDHAGQPHINDFGLAKRIDTDSAMTMSGAIVGTPSYVAPEQAAGTKQLTTAADIYGLGAIFYELLAGRPPFMGATVMETLQKVMNEEAMPPSEVRSSRREEAPTKAGKKDQSLLTSVATKVDRDLETICLKCLEKDPTRRYGSAEALADDLERWLAHKPIRARPITSAERLHKWVQRNPLLASGAVALIFVGALGLAGILWQWRATVAANARTAQANDSLWQTSYLGARYWTRSGGVGQRSNALAIIQTAAALRPSVELRNEALAALLLPDLGARLSWKPGESGIYPWCFDAALDHYVPHDEAGLVAICRAADHSIVRKLGRGRAGTAYAQFSPDDRFLAVSFESRSIPVELRVWEWRTGRLVAQTTNAHAKFGIASFDFTPDGRELLYADRSAGLGRLNIADGQPLPPLLTNVAAIVRVSPDGAYVATGKGLRVEVWETASGRHVAGADFSRFPNTPYLQALAWAPNGGGLVVSCFGTGLYLLRLNDSPPEHFGDAKNIVATSLFFNATGDLLFAGGWDDLFQIWDMSTLTPLIHESHAHGSPRALSRDGRRLALVRERVGLGVWEFSEPAGLRKFIQPLDVHPWPVALDVHPTGRWLVTTHQDAWLLWDTARARVVARGTAKPFTTAKLTPEGAAFHTCGPEGLQRWPLHEVENSNHTFQISIGSAELLSPGYAGSVFSADGRYVAMLGSDSIFRVNLTNHSFARPVPIRRQGDNIVGISADGRWLCMARHNQPGNDIYDLEEGTFAKTLDEAGEAGGLFSARPGEFVASNTRGLTFWQTGVWKLHRELPLADLGLGRSLAAFAPDDRVAWFNWPPQMKLLDVTTGHFFATLEHPATVYSGLVAFDATASRAYAANGNGIIVWDLAALRRELVRLGLDWRDENPSGSFAPRQP